MKPLRQVHGTIQQLVRRMMRHIQLTAQAKQVIRYQMALHRIQPIQVQVRIQVLARNDTKQYDCR